MKLLTFRPARARSGHLGVLLADNRVLDVTALPGRECCEVPPAEAYDCVFGYTIMNDLSCRDVQFAERKEGNICIGKNFPTAAPLGPWIVTKDEIPAPHNLRIVTRVNGEVRQDSNTANQIHQIPAQTQELISA